MLVRLRQVLGTVWAVSRSGVASVQRPKDYAWRAERISLRSSGLRLLRALHRLASVSPSRPALYLGNTFWKSDDPQLCCLARSDCKPTIDPVVCRLCGVLCDVPYAGAERGEASEWRDRGGLHWCCCAQRSPSPVGALLSAAASSGPASSIPQRRSGTAERHAAQRLRALTPGVSARRWQP